MIDLILADSTTFAVAFTPLFNLTYNVQFPALFPDWHMSIV